MSMDMVEMAMEMVNEVASVWVFLGGARGWHSGTNIDTIIVYKWPKGRLEMWSNYLDI